MAAVAEVTNKIKNAHIPAETPDFWLAPAFLVT